MAFGNGSHHLKRGFLRPNGGSRLPAFLILALVAGCSFLLYNVYTTTVDRNSLLEELSLTKKKWQSCQRDKTELETRFETHVRSFKTMKDELERLRTIERNVNEVQKELKQCREQMVTLQNENADIKEEQKTDVEGCQRKLKTAEENLDACSQEKSRFEGEITGLRSNLSAALQQAQARSVPMGRVDDGQTQSSKTQETDTNAAPVVPPHRGAPIDAVESNNAPKVSNRTESSQQEANASIGAGGGKSGDRGQGQLQTSAVQAVTNTLDQLNANGSKDVAGPATNHGVAALNDSEITAATAQENKQTSNAMQAAETSVAQGAFNTKLPDLSKVLDTAKNQEFFSNENETNGTSNRADAPSTVFDEMSTKATKIGSLYKRRKQKERRLNKVVEEDVPADQRRRKVSDRGEKLEEERAVDSDRAPLRAAVPSRINVGDRPGQPSDIEEKKDGLDNGKVESRIDAVVPKARIDAAGDNSKIDGAIPNSKIDAVAPRSKIDTDTSNSKVDAFVPIGKKELDGASDRKDGDATHAVNVDLKNRMPDAKEVGMAPPLEKPVIPKPKAADFRKGLKDDYQYRDDDEEAEAPKNRPKKALGNEVNEAADTKVEKHQVQDRVQAEKLGGDSDPKGLDLVAMKKEAKLAGEDEELDKRMPKDEDMDKHVPKDGFADSEA